MTNLFKLIYNELFKIYILKSTWIMYIVLAVIIAGSGFLASAFDDYITSYSDDNWQEELQQENENLEQEMREVGLFQEYNTLEIEKNNYYLENDIKPFSYGAWQFTNDQQSMMSIVSLLTIIVAGVIIANEFRWGTINRSVRHLVIFRSAAHFLPWSVRHLVISGRCRTLFSILNHTT